MGTPGVLGVSKGRVEGLLSDVEAVVNPSVSARVTTWVSVGSKGSTLTGMVTGGGPTGLIF